MIKYIEVSAEVRYWEDATVNGEEDTEGELIPDRFGDLWCPTIRLADGMVMEWPAGTTAEIHYKVCDAGEYWLLDDARMQELKWKGHYVPDSFLCHGDTGHGDYIIFNVDEHGMIKGWRQPCISEDDWKKIEEEAV